MKNPIGVENFLNNLTGVSQWAGHPTLKQQTAQGRITVNMAAVGVITRTLFLRQWPNVDPTTFNGTYNKRSGKLSLSLEGSMLEWAAFKSTRVPERHNFERIDKNRCGLEATIGRDHLRRCICRWFVCDMDVLEFRAAVQILSFFRHFHSDLRVQPKVRAQAEAVLATIEKDVCARRAWDGATGSLPADYPVRSGEPLADRMAQRFPDVAKALQA